jgi:multidrug efflux pump
MARFFIDHPVFAWVIAILITLAGILSITRLAIEAYPDIAPPQIQVSANYPGADAEVVEHTVTQIIEQSLTGIDHLLYFTSSSNSKGNANVTLTFDTGTDPDTAVVQTQNRMTLATPRLPAEVNALGLTVQKASTSNVIVLALQSTDGSMNSYELSNLLATRVLDQIQRINGVANVQQFGSEYAMRIWLNPDRLHAYGISPAQVLATVQSQNLQIAAGSIGAVPTVPNQQLSINVTVPGRFTSLDQFENIILRTNPNGTTVRLRDVARLELGPYAYGLDDKVDGKPIAGCGIAVLQGADVLKVVQAIRDRMNELQRSFPPGVTWVTPFDATKFISVSIREVVYTLAGSVVLVFLVMLVFLQNIRATLIPTLVMPVALLGAFVGIYAVGFPSIP